MKDSYKNRTFIWIFIAGAVFSLLALNGCASSLVSANTLTKIEGKKEILVARDIGRGGEIYLIRWCGNNGLAYRIVDTDDAEMLDFQTGKRTPIDIGPHDILLNCTPDGKKLFYLPSETDPDGGYGWYGETVEMYRYDMETSEKTFVASVKEPISYDAVSPDGTKILLGERHRLASKIGAPEMEGVWFTEKWDPSEATWFPDSSGVLAYGGEHAGIICIEIFGKDGWAKCFNIVDMEGSSDAPRADRKNRVYFLYVEFDIMTELERMFLHRCDLRNRELLCERIIKNHNVMPTYGFLPDGDIVFQDYDDALTNCILRITPGQKTARCEIYPQYGDSVYDRVSLRGVSPNGRWLVFDRYTTKGWKKRTDGMGSDLWQGQMDMFVIDLLNE